MHQPHGALQGSSTRVLSTDLPATSGLWTAGSLLPSGCFSLPASGAVFILLPRTNLLPAATPHLLTQAQSGVLLRNICIFTKDKFTKQGGIPSDTDPGLGDTDGGGPVRAGCREVTAQALHRDPGPLIHRLILELKDAGQAAGLEEQSGPP